LDAFPASGRFAPIRILIAALVALALLALLVLPAAAPAASSHRTAAHAATAHRTTAHRTTAHRSTAKAQIASVRHAASRASRQVRSLRAAVRRACHKTRTSRACKRQRAKLARATAQAKRAQSKLRHLVRTSSDSRSKPKKKKTSKKSAKTSTRQPAIAPKAAAPAPKAGTTAPAAAPSSGTPTGAPPAPAGSTPAPASLSGPVTGITFQPGLNAGTWLEYDVPGSRSLGAKEVRLEFPPDTTVAELTKHFAAYADAGIRIMLLAGFPGSMPTTAQARNLATWAQAFGPGGTFWANRSDGRLAMRAIEFGNETSGTWQYGDTQFSSSYTARAQAYALRFRDARLAIDATGMKVGLLAQADDWTGRWVDGMYSAVPNFDQYVDAWVVHPYGTDWSSKLSDAVRQTRAHGAPDSIPIDVTEWGLATDNGTCLNDNYGQDRCMTWASAANVLRTTVAQMRAQLQGRLRRFMLYQDRDNGYSGASTDREAFFGALQRNLAEKGAFSAAVRTLLAS
jgi:hypothetical protein